MISGILHACRITTEPETENAQEKRKTKNDTHMVSYSSCPAVSNISPVMHKRKDEEGMYEGRGILSMIMSSWEEVTVKKPKLTEIRLACSRRRLSELVFGG